MWAMEDSSSTITLFQVTLHSEIETSPLAASGKWNKQLLMWVVQKLSF